MYNVASVFTVLVFIGPPHLFASGACTDNHNSCSDWAGIGECSKNPLWMLDNCPVSCKVCSGVPACVNIYNDQYCKSNVGNCWTSSIAADLVKNCRKTCVCKCCPSSPTTVPTTAYVHNATRYTTVSALTSATTSVEIATTSALTSATTTVEITTTAKDISTTPQTTSTITNSTPNEERTTVQTEYTSAIPDTRRIVNETSQDKGATETSGSKTMLVLVITMGCVAFVAVLGILLLWFRRRRRSSSRGSLNQVKVTVENNSTPPEEVVWLERQPEKSSRNPLYLSANAAENIRFSNHDVAEDTPEVLYSTTIPSSPTSPLYHMLEDPNTTDTNGKSALSAPSERPSDPLRSDSDYDEPVFRGVRPAIFPPPGARENEANYETMTEDRNAERLADNAGKNALENVDEYCYSYTTAYQNKKDEATERPKTEGPSYCSIESPNNEYQAPIVTPGGGCTPVAGIAEVNGYQPLQKSTRSFYQPLIKDN